MASILSEIAHPETFTAQEAMGSLRTGFGIATTLADMKLRQRQEDRIAANEQTRLAMEQEKHDWEMGQAELKGKLQNMKIMQSLISTALYDMKPDVTPEGAHDIPSAQETQAHNERVYQGLLGSLNELKMPIGDIPLQYVPGIQSELEDDLDTFSAVLGATQGSDKTKPMQVYDSTRGEWVYRTPARINADPDRYNLTPAQKALLGQLEKTYDPEYETYRLPDGSTKTIDIRSETPKSNWVPYRETDFERAYQQHVTDSKANGVPSLSRGEYRKKYWKETEITVGGEVEKGLEKKEVTAKVNILDDPRGFFESIAREFEKSDRTSRKFIYGSTPEEQEEAVLNEAFRQIKKRWPEARLQRGKTSGQIFVVIPGRKPIPFDWKSGLREGD